MAGTTKVTLAQALRLDQIATDGSFNHAHVLDLRCDENGRARAIEESVLKKLANHFIRYTQMPVALDDTGPCQEVHVCETINDMDGRVLVLTDHVTQIAALMNIFRIPFESKVFYVVETGMGDRLAAIQEQVAEKPAQMAAATF